MSFAPPVAEDRVATWALDWEGRTYRYEDLTVAHMATVFLLSGNQDWSMLSPAAVDPESGYMAAVFLLAAFEIHRIADERGIAPDSQDEDAARVVSEVIVDLRNRRMSEVVEAVRFL